MSGTVCTTHPEAEAVFGCAVCAKSYCDACRRVRANGSEVCPGCSDEKAVTKTGFCSQCLSESTDYTPGNISTTNGVGRKFYGGAQPCPNCGSVVKVLWWVLVDVPLIPRGCYRFKETKSDNVSRYQFLARRTHWRWPQVFTQWAVGLVVGAIAFTLIIAWSNRKK